MPLPAVRACLYRTNLRLVVGLRVCVAAAPRAAVAAEDVRPNRLWLDVLITLRATEVSCLRLRLGIPFTTF